MYNVHTHLYKYIYINEIFYGGGWMGGGAQIRITASLVMGPNDNDSVGWDWKADDVCVCVCAQINEIVDEPTYTNKPNILYKAQSMS